MFPHRSLVVVSDFGEERAGKAGALGVGWCTDQLGWEGGGELLSGCRQNC